MRLLKFIIIIIIPNVLISQKYWTLQECVDRALEMNISIKQSELDYAGSEIDKKAPAKFHPFCNGRILTILKNGYCRAVAGSECLIIKNN